MRYLSTLAAAALVTIAGATVPAQDAGWVSLFDGKSLDGWKVGENAASFSVADGAIVINGPRAHLYYVGPVGNHDFKNFEFKADVMTTPGSNSGIYFHTAYQEGGWPSKGYEVQVNNSHTDPKRTAGLYAVKDNMEAPAKDDEWFTMQIVVQGKHVTTSVNGKTIVGLHRARRRRAAGRHEGAPDLERHVRAAGPRPEEQGAREEHHGQGPA